MKTKIFLSVILSGLLINTATYADEPKHAEEAGAVHWSYEGAGSPEHWGDLKAEFSTCSLGKHQSPIDITKTQHAKLPAIKFNYQPSTGKITNTGHSIQVDLEDGGTAVFSTGTYKLVQFHFHTPSEEKIHGKSRDMVIHLVHKNDQGQLAVLAVLYHLGKHSNSALAKIFDNFPQGDVGTSTALPQAFNASDLLPVNHKKYYAFTGSLTTPPCTEEVSWQILKSEGTLSPKQLDQFKKFYPMNARPVQPLNGRAVKIRE